MTKIIQIRNSDIKKIIKMIEYVSPGLSPGMINDKIFIPFPFNFIHRILPLNWKFMQECYVAVENNEPLGFISLAPDGNNKTRWKINRLVLGMNAYDVGKQLIDYVVNKYGGAGVEIFLSVIDENYTEAISLFKNSCSFRHISRINIWEYDGPYSGEKTEILSNLRKLSKNDSKKLHELDTEAILPQYRTSLAKHSQDFKPGLKNNILNLIKGHKSIKYVLDNPSNDRIEALISIFTADNMNFWVDITISLAYREYYNDILGFAINEINSYNKEAKIYIGVKDYHNTGKYMTEILSNHKFNMRGNFQVLVKDYWKPAGFYKERKMPAIIFPDLTSPACNIIRFISET